MGQVREGGHRRREFIFGRPPASREKSGTIGGSPEIRLRLIFYFLVTPAGALRLSDWTTHVRCSNHMRITRSTAFVSATALLLFCLILPGSSQAQGFDGLSQLLGGGGLGGLTGNSGNSGQSNAPVAVQRNTPPYTGMFSGKTTTGSETKSLDAKFACYPAHDPAFNQTDTFVCYAAK